VHDSSSISAWWEAMTQKVERATIAFQWLGHFTSCGTFGKSGIEEFFRTFS
jgi:hypothetical protein